MNAPHNAPKKGMSTLTIVLIIVGVVLLVAVGTCGAGAIWLGHKAKEVKESIADGGLVLVSPPAVVADLGGPKKEYVGSWISASGQSTLDIQPDGALKLVQNERGTKQKLTAPIAAFVGNDIEIRFGITVTLDVAAPPRRTNQRWEMTVRGIQFQRN